MAQQTLAGGITRTRLWFSQLGGAVAWMIHLMGCYAIAEFGCASRFSAVHWLGITGTSWILIAVSLVLCGVSAVAALAGRRSEAALRDPQGIRGPVGESRHPDVYIAHAGWITSGIFVFIIAVESVPPFFFLQRCG